MSRLLRNWKFSVFLVLRDVCFRGKQEVDVDGDDDDDDDGDEDLDVDVDVDVCFGQCRFIERLKVSGETCLDTIVVFTSFVSLSS